MVKSQSIGEILRHSNWIAQLEGYAGYYDKMIGVYTHTSNQLSVLNTQAISCAPRESLYVIDGLLDNNTILAIKRTHCGAEPSLIPLT